MVQTPMVSQFASSYCPLEMPREPAATHLTMWKNQAEASSRELSLETNYLHDVMAEAVMAEAEEDLAALAPVITDWRQKVLTATFLEVETAIRARPFLAVVVLVSKVADQGLDVKIAADVEEEAGVAQKEEPAEVRVLRRLRMSWTPR